MHLYIKPWGELGSAQWTASALLHPASQLYRPNHDSYMNYGTSSTFFHSSPSRTHSVRRCGSCLSSRISTREGRIASIAKLLSASVSSSLLFWNQYAPKHGQTSLSSFVGHDEGGGAAESALPGVAGRAKVALSAGLRLSNSSFRRWDQIDSSPPKGMVGDVAARPRTRTWTHSAGNNHAISTWALEAIWAVLGIRLSVVDKKSCSSVTFISWSDCWTHGLDGQYASRGVTHSPSSRSRKLSSGGWLWDEPFAFGLAAMSFSRSGSHSGRVIVSGLRMR